LASISATHFDGDDPTWAVAATQRRHPQATRPQRPEPDVSPAAATGFWPEMPQSLDETGLRATQVEALVLKFLLNLAQASGREIARQVALPFGVVQQLLFAMKSQHLVSLKSDAALGDYVYELTEFGAENARRFAEQCTYFGAAPVPLEQYAVSVRTQAIQQQPLSLGSLKRAFHDLVLDEAALGMVGEALNLGRGMFLHGPPGNGKSSIGERLARVFSRHIWIPRALTVGGSIVRLYDSTHHIQADEEADGELQQRPFDPRWIRIKRPALVVGGELDLGAFDVVSNRVTGINEAPVQLKANCGILVIDDFGRNRFQPAELLNRLVVPLERGVDSFHLKSGRTFQAPFECMLVFASNAAPSEIVDEAFLRRIPYKIAVRDPSEQQFKELYRTQAEQLSLQTSDDDVEYLLERHYRQKARPLRFCYPRDLLQIIANMCAFYQRPNVVTQEAIDQAVDRYIGLNARSTPKRQPTK
jgi:predicted ATPase with chaperone activity